ncbi:MAG: pilus assembly protein [Gammaproteobacteria bacterium]|nr:pilus assembly protein [Gammaproteobacteria bacterium]TVQ43861.1 MAG: hypothetical protein EA371_14410 [Gammaproteobacteria bacterium]
MTIVPTVQSTRPPRQQRGMALVISLILLLLMSLIGLTAMQSSTLQERMAGNTRDRHLAFEAAEAALREGEAFLDQPTLPDFTNTAGLYQGNAANRPVWHGPAQAAGNGVRTFSGDIGTAVAQPPEYFIEELRDIILPGTETELPPPPTSISYFRITSRGFGGTAESVVVLSTIYRRD